ncbi:MAG: AtpZ/AtpI family protein [Saprospiraceae bacterium]|nr:AtpZ/AtpI family protein [Saprospiraceae bacterium]
MTRKPLFDQNKTRAYLKYSGMALQFFALIAIGAWLGQKLDARLNTSKPFITIFLILFFSTGYFIKLYKDLTR